jgi:D-beta-D-heptose 7-phosphate kinase/D-beta-D-heptose 1-phosphate adenosyltransferase
MKIIVNGCFDLFHDGHKYILGIACNWADKGELLILLNSDYSVKELKGENRPINNENTRRYNITQFCRQFYPKTCIAIAPFSTEEELSKYIDEYKPDMIIKGNDRPDVRDIIGSKNWPVCIIPRLKKDGKEISTSNLIL